MKSELNLEQVAGYILLILLTVLLALIAIYSLEWRTGYDPAWLLYVGRLIDQHQMTPYLDIHDPDFPGGVFLYVLIGKAIGFSNERLLRVIDLGVLAMIGVALWSWLRPLGRRVAWGAAALFGLAYLTSDITVATQRDYFLILPLVWSAAISVRLTRWSPVIRCALVGLLCGLAGTVKPHALIGLPIIVGYIYFESQDVEPQQRLARLAKIGFSSFAGLLIPITVTALYLIVSGSLLAFIDLETRYVPLYSHVTSTLTMLDGLERFNYILASYIGFNGLGWWFVPAGLGVVLTLRTHGLERQKRWLVYQMVGLATGYSLYPAISGQFYNYHWLPFLCFMMALSALSLRGLPELSPVVFRWLPILTLIGALVLTPSQVLDTFSRLNRYYIEKQPIPSTDGGVADELADYLREAHLQRTDRIQVLGSSGSPLHGLLLVDALPATRFLLDLPLYHNLSQPIIQEYRRTFMLQLEQSQPRFVVDMYHRLYFFGSDSSTAFPEFSEWLAENYHLAYVGRAFSIYELQPDIDRGFVVYPLKEADIPVRYHPEAADDVLPLTAEQTVDTQSVGDRASGFISPYDVIQVEFLSEQDPNRAVESWFSQHTFRINEHWINATRVVEYLVASPECLEMQVSRVVFGPSIRLEKSAVAVVEKGRAEWVCVSLDWSSIQPLADSYKFSVRVVGPDGQVVAAYDSQLAGYLAPTTSWKPGETFQDHLALPLPDNLPNGRYQIALVVYNETTLERLPLTDPIFQGDTHILTTFTPRD